MVYCRWRKTWMPILHLLFAWCWTALYLEKLIFIGSLLCYKIIRDFAGFNFKVINIINRYWSLRYRITLKQDKEDLEGKIIHFLAIYGNEDYKMLNLTRLVFHLECGFNLKFGEFLRLLVKLDRQTLIKISLLYIMDDIPARTLLLITAFFDHYTWQNAEYIM